MNKDNLNKAYELILSRIDETLSVSNYQKTKVDVLDNGEELTVFKGEDVAYCVIYHEDITQFELDSCAVDADNELDNNWNKITAWLFDSDNDTIRDAENISQDFIDTLGGAKRVAAVKQMKKKKKKNEDTNVDSLFFMNRLVNIWPDLKEDIKFEKENYETFRGVNFSREKVLSRFTETINGDNENKKKKLLSLLDDEYKVGDLDVRGIITIILLNSIDDKEKISEIEGYFSRELNKAWKYSRKIKGKNIKPEKPKKKKQGFMARTLAESQNQSHK